MSETFIVYASMLLLCVFFAHLAEKTGKLFYVTSVVVVLSFVCGCRGKTVGNDTPIYLQIFDNLVHNSNYYSSSSYFEMGFLQLSKFFIRIYPDARFVMICYSLLTFSFIIYALWQYRNYASFTWSVVLFIVSFYSFFQSGLRQALALGIAFFASSFLRKRHYWFYIFSIIAAYFIHTSVLICFIFIAIDIVDWKTLQTKQKIVLFLGMVFLPVMFRSLISIFSRYTQYTDVMHIRLGIGIPIKLFFLVICLIVLREKQHVDEQTYINHNKDCIHQLGNKYSYIKENSMRLSSPSINTKDRIIPIYYMMGLLLSLTGYIFYNIARISFYFYIYETIYLSHVVKKETKNKNILTIGVILLCAYLFYNSFIKGSGYMQVPYYFFWENS